MPSIQHTIAVHGRFHAFHLAKALNDVGHPARLLTTHTMREVEEFGLSPGLAICNPQLGFLHRLSYRFHIPQRMPSVEKMLHKAIGRWVTSIFHKYPTEVLHSFSGISHEVFHDLHRQPPCVRTLKLLMRGSAHIREQHQELSCEARRAGAPIELPSDWMIFREIDEYDLSDAIITLSDYGRNSFLRQGYQEQRVYSLPLAADVKKFRPDEQTLKQRLERIHSGARLQVVYAGNISLQKGMMDFVEVAKALSHCLDFTLIGTITPDAAALIQDNASHCKHVPRVSECELPFHFHNADVFLMPTIHDGFAVVLAQAKSACLPVISTFNSGAPDIIAHGTEGWLVPIRSPDRIIDILCRWYANRAELADIVSNLWHQNRNRTWHDVAGEFLSISEKTKASLKQK